jgi:virginiamycin B lyase
MNAPSVRIGLVSALTVVCTLLLTPASSGAAQGSVTVFPLPAGSRPHVIAIGPDGAAWFSVAGGRCRGGVGNKIDRITPDGTITEYPIPTADSYPGALAFGPDSAVWFGERRANQIGHLTRSGAIAEFPVPTAVSDQNDDVVVPGLQCTWDSSSPAEGGIVVGPDRALWFTEGTGNRIGRIGLDGEVTEYAIPTAESNPIGIDRGPDGALWFIERAGNKVGRVTLDGMITEYPIPTSQSFPNVIVAGPDGALWFTELRGDKLGRITPDGTISEYPAGGTGPVGLAFGPDGAWWLGGYTSSLLVRMTLDGVVTDRYTVDIPEGTAGLCCGVAAGPDGSIWFTATEASLVGHLRVQPAPPPAQIPGR